MSNRTFKTITRNGKKFNLLTLPGTNFFKFQIVNEYGANIERVVKEKTGKNVYGISHLIEHLSFKSSKDYTTDEIIKIKKNEGACNAGTSYDRIFYWFETNMSKVDKAIRVICNIALNDLQKVSKDEFEREKKVVFNESKRYHDDDQTMFYFNSIRASLGYEEGDNIIAFPEQVKTLELEDAKDIKNIFIHNNEYIYNVVYDSELIGEEEMLLKIENELKRFESKPNSELIISDEEYRAGLSSIKEGSKSIKNESEQAMTMMAIDTVENMFVSDAACEYLGQIADKTSLNYLIREKNGLTYGLNLYVIEMAYKNYVVFSCDVSKGTEEKMMELFKESIDKSCKAWDTIRHKELVETLDLDRTMENINQKKYSAWFRIALYHPEFIEKHEDMLKNNLDSIYSVIDKDVLTYENIKDAITSINMAVQNNKYGIVTNIS